LKTFALAIAASLALLGGCATEPPGDPLANAVVAALKQDENVSKFDFKVDNAEGKVTVAGNVKNEFQQYQAGVVAKKVPGVKSVDNQVKVAE
jgi:osmotically-inducible protein OsmY